MEIKTITIKQMVENIIESKDEEENQKYFIYDEDDNNFYGITNIDIINKRIEYNNSNDYIYYKDLETKIYQIVINN